ncbi:cell cycle control protein Cdc123 [Peziza echinospora]|nr:cell cycle control protein Cdc123 [Peziza echinospora]
MSTDLTTTSSRSPSPSPSGSDSDSSTPSRSSTPTPTSLPFPPLTHTHILNCALPTWYTLYRPHLPKTRILPLPASFISYLRADGIFLPPSNPTTSAYDNITTTSSGWDSDDDALHGYPNLAALAISQRERDEDSGNYSTTDTSDSEDDEAAPAQDPTLLFPTLHAQIIDTIASLGGAVFPKLDWSAPKDATWITPTNSLECRSPSEIYLVLKSSDFITHDLEYPFEGCVVAPEKEGEGEGEGEAQFPQVNYHLVLRKYFTVNPSVEFRCFVKNRVLVGLCQRDLNHFEFLRDMREEIVELVTGFYEKVLKATFPDDNFTFDVYIPRTQSKVWLMDINPWAQRTDPLLFSWLEILTLDETKIEKPELRLVNKDDPEAYCFNTPQYSAHKLPKEVVDAGMGGAASIQEFAQRWREIVNNMPDS